MSAWEQPPEDYIPDSEEFFELSLGFHLRRSFNKIVEAVDKSLAEYSLSSHQYGVLVTIFYRRANTPSAIAKLRYQNGGAITYTLDRLEQRGLINRIRSTDDRRVVTLELTEEGDALMRQTMQMVRRTVAEFASPLTEAEKLQLFDMLARLSVED